MNLIHLPTLDGSPEAAVARLDALDQQYRLNAIQSGVWEASAIVNDLVDLAPGRHGAFDEAICLRASHEAVLDNVQYEIDRLVSS